MPGWMECTEPRIWKRLSDSQEGSEPSVHKGGNEHPGQGWGGPRESRKYTGEGQPNQTKSLSQNSNVVCFGCKHTGHIKRECPSKQLNRIRSPTPSTNKLEKIGTVNGIPCEFHMDTGADMAAVPPSMVKKIAVYRGEMLCTFRRWVEDFYENCQG